MTDYFLEQSFNFEMPLSCKQSLTSPLSLTMISDCEESASGGGVSVSMESTGVSWVDVFSLLGMCSSEGVVVGISSGGGVCISGSRFKDGWSCASLSDPESSDTEVTG